MTFRLGPAVLAAFALAAPALLAQTDRTPPRVAKPAISNQPWPEDDVLLARRTDAQNRELFRDGALLAFTLAADFGQINKERTPDNGKAFPGVLTVGDVGIPVTLGSRGHLRLKSSTCSFVPIKIAFARQQLAGTIF